MAISKNRTTIDYNWEKFYKSVSGLPLTSLEQLYQKILPVELGSLHPLARRQITKLLKQYKYHPHKSVYIYYINFIILDDKLFRNLFSVLSCIYRKKSEKKK
ncbi:MAG: hypothetical protein ACFFDF_03590 [Candidatus Odinarchaeota archaeon]